jgi:hypothetical protein
MALDRQNGVMCAAPREKAVAVFTESRIEKWLQDLQQRLLDHLVHRLAVSIHAPPHSVTLMQLRFTSFAVVSLRQDFHPQDCAHAGRITKSPARKNLGGAYLSSALSTDDGQ